uniref:CHK domain-containing protein n=1 Tax=Parastrongyloides trichosuri TaxID=131310 RepID=A0A0N4ZLT4_PARTI
MKIIFKVENYKNFFIDKTSVNLQWIIDSLTKNSNEFVKQKGDSAIREIDYENIGTEDRIVSYIYKLSIFFDNPDSEPFNAILKVNTLRQLDDAVLCGNISRDDYNSYVDFVINSHQQEALFYNLISNKVKNIKVPECYGSIFPTRNYIKQKDGAFLISCLDNGRILPLDKSFSIKEAESVLDQVLNLQIFSLTKGKEFKLKLRKQNEKNKHKKLIQNSWLILRNIFHHNILDEIQTKYTALCIRSSNRCRNQGEFSVIAHGNLYSKNIMLEMDSENVKGIIDWKGITEDSMGSDIARFLITSCSSEVRKELEINYLPKYFDKLISKVDLRITYDSFRQSYDACFIEGVLHSLITFGLYVSDINNYVSDYANLSSRIYNNIKDAYERMVN